MATISSVRVGNETMLEASVDPQKGVVFKVISKAGNAVIDAHVARVLIAIRDREALPPAKPLPMEGL